jgi:glycosyltransferase involved in cell wall biosynthesis
LLSCAKPGFAQGGRKGIKIVEYKLMEEKGLKVLMISSDRNILAPGGAVRERMLEYGKLVEELHIVVMSDKGHGLKEAQLGTNVWAYPTNSGASFLRPLGARKLGNKIVFDRKFVRGRSLVTADSIEAGWAGLGIKRRWRIPLEVQIHSDPFSVYFKGFQNKVRKILAKRVFSRADRVRVVSVAVGQILHERLKISKEKEYVLPIYIDREKIENAEVTFDAHARFGWRFIILAVARLAPEKNLGFALRVLAGVRARHPEVGLVVLGSGRDEERLKKLAGELGVESNVAFLGWVENPASYYRTANAFLQTSHFEGYGIALVEAGLSGLPVVTTPVGIALDLENNKDAYVCPHGNLEYFVDAITELVEHNEAREKLRINMKRTLEEKLLSKEKYLSELKENWEKTAREVESRITK